MRVCCSFSAVFKKKKKKNSWEWIIGKIFFVSFSLALGDNNSSILFSSFRFWNRFETLHFVSNKAKGRISKWVFEENKARQIFRKTSISHPVIRTRLCAYQGVRNVRFSENLVCFVFFKQPFWDSSFVRIDA